MTAWALTRRAVWPNLFVVGAARAGTTSLWRYLDQHPDIWMAPIKEPHFFSERRPRLYRSIDDEESYLRLFAPGADAKLRGEASPSYLWHQGAARAIKRVSPDARIVIMLRDPVERAHSAYWHAVCHGAEKRSFLEAVEAELEQPWPDGLPSRLVGRSFYAEPVARYLGLFPETVHVLFFEEFAQNVRREVRNVLEFLGVDAGVAERFDATVHNAFAQPRGRAAQLVHNSPRVRTIARRLAPWTPYPMVERLLLKRTEKPPLEDEAAALLTGHFRSDVERLRRILGRDPPWPRYRQPHQAGDATP